MQRSKPSIHVTPHERGKLVIVHIHNTISEPHEFDLPMYFNDYVYSVRSKLSKKLELDTSQLVLYFNTSSDSSIELVDEQQLKNLSQFSIFVKKTQVNPKVIFFFWKAHPIFEGGRRS